MISNLDESRQRDFSVPKSTERAAIPVVKRWLGRSRRHQLVRLMLGLAALVALVARVSWGHDSPPPAASSLIWATALLATVLLIWRERNQTVAHHRTLEEHARFIAAAETSPDAFFILDAVRGKGGEIEDFGFAYVNGHGETLLETQRKKLLENGLCTLFPINRTNGNFEKYRKVVETGEALQEDYATRLADGNELWLRQRVNKLGDGVAIRTSDTTELKVTEERYRNLANFRNSVFESAPYSIIEVDTSGTIQTVNAAGERLTGYKREEIAGRLPLTALYDPHDLARTQEAGAEQSAPVDGFGLLTARAMHGEVDEREWTYVRKDGTTLPVHVAVTAVRNGDEEITGFVAIASDITERKQLMTYLNHMASHDQLTGLPGRTLLRERIAEAIEKAILHGRKVAVFVVDLDHFKRLNDSLGHRSGDQVLVGMAERVRTALRRSDTLGRLGGDELIVVMPHIAHLSDVEKCAQRLVDRVSSTAQIGEMEVNLSASVGVCVYPDFAENVDSLLERADAATYAAKANGRNQFQLFSEAMLKESQTRLSMDTALRHALAREELFLHYQPLVSLSTGRVIGMESLLRWHHPKLGVVPPSTFIPLAEDTGLIVPIGEWAMKESCRQAKLICDDLATEFSVSVNLSPRQFEQENLLDVIRQALEESGLPPRLLQVELTENTLMVNSTSNLEKLQEIRQMGARVAIDDFGTGFSSFSYLLQYPVDRLKIDQSFVLKAVTERNAATVVRTIVAMSHHLGIKVIAEGVETLDHVKLLAQRRCDEAQGYYFSRPVTAAGFGEAVRSIQRMFDERRLMDDIRAAAGRLNSDDMEPGRGLEEPATAFAPMERKQVVM